MFRTVNDTEPTSSDCRHLSQVNVPYRRYVQLQWHTASTEQQLEMWANAQRDGRPAEYKWRPLFNATKFG